MKTTYKALYKTEDNSWNYTIVHANSKKEAEQKIHKDYNSNFPMRGIIDIEITNY